MISGTKLGSIRQIALVMHDVAKAVPFYRDQLGMTLQFEIAGMAFFDAGGVRLMLSKPSAKEFDHPNSILYFTVPDILAAHADLKARGVVFVEEPHSVGKTATHDVWIAGFKDPEGNFLQIMQERALKT
jgi:predicted enzyme related to lactoylglutathione lyase